MNSGTLGTLAVLALVGATSPFSLIAFSLVLATDRGTKNGIAFIAGWITTVTAICVVAGVIGSAASADSGESSDVALGIQIGLGAVMVMLWVRRRLRREITGVDEPIVEKPQPAWQRRIASMRAPGAFVLGGATQTWPVMIAGGAEIARSGMSIGAEVAYSVVFAMVTASGIVILEVLAVRSPGSAAARLDRIQNYVNTHRDAVINWVLFGGGLYLLGRGILGLVG